jgi:hypothetical protein
MCCTVPNQKAHYPNNDRDYRGEGATEDQLRNWNWEFVGEGDTNIDPDTEEDPGRPAVVDAQGVIHFPIVHDNACHQFVDWNGTVVEDDVWSPEEHELALV